LIGNAAAQRDLLGINMDEYFSELEARHQTSGFPNLNLITQNGDQFDLSSLEGKSGQTMLSTNGSTVLKSVKLSAG